MRRRRIGKEIDWDGDAEVDEIVRYVYDGDHIALQFSGDEAEDLTHRYLHGEIIDQIFADEELLDDLLNPGDAYWLLGDNLGTIRDIAQYDAGENETAVVNHVTYDAFGNITAQTEPVHAIIFGYVGREFDPETGLLYYRARYYDPVTSLFISPDPIEDDVANFYRYVTNSPTNFTDPTGHELFARGKKSADAVVSWFESQIGVTPTVLALSSDNNLYYIIAQARDGAAIDRIIQRGVGRDGSKLSSFDEKMYAAARSLSTHQLVYWDGKSFGIQSFDLKSLDDLQFSHVETILDAIQNAGYNREQHRLLFSDSRFMQRTYSDPDRQQLLLDAAGVGLEADIRDILEKVDNQRTRYTGLEDWIRISYHYATDEVRISGECGWWTVDMARRLSGGKADLNPKINLSTVYIEQKRDPASSECQNAIRIQFRAKDGEIATYYIDNGGIDYVLGYTSYSWTGAIIGEHGQVFTEKERISFQQGLNDASNSFMWGTTSDVIPFNENNL